MISHTRNETMPSVQHHDYPDFTAPGRRWKVIGSRRGKLTNEYFLPEEEDNLNAGPPKSSWVWVDELLLTLEGGEPPEILIDAHGRHEYSGYDLHVRKQPVVTAFSRHDHIISA